MRKLFIMLLLAGGTNAQWTPIKGFQEESPGNFSYYSIDKQNAIDMCKEVLRVNDVNLATIHVDKNHDPIINNHLHKPDQPDMMYMVYVAKTTSGYAVRLIYKENKSFEIDEAYMTIVYESVEWFNIWQVCHHVHDWEVVVLHWQGHSYWAL